MEGGIKKGKREKRNPSFSSLPSLAKYVTGELWRRHQPSKIELTPWRLRCREAPCHQIRYVRSNASEARSFDEIRNNSHCWTGIGSSSSGLSRWTLRKPSRIGVKSSPEGPDLWWDNQRFSRCFRADPATNRRSDTTTRYAFSRGMKLSKGSEGLLWERRILNFGTITPLGADLMSNGEVLIFQGNDEV